MKVTCTRFLVVNGISIISLWNMFEQEGFRRNERYH